MGICLRGVWTCSLFNSADGGKILICIIKWILNDIHRSDGICTRVIPNTAENLIAQQLTVWQGMILIDLIFLASLDRNMSTKQEPELQNDWLIEWKVRSSYLIHPHRNNYTLVMLKIRRNYNKSTTRGGASILSAVSTSEWSLASSVLRWRQGRAKGVVNRFFVLVSRWMDGQPEEH